MAANWLESARRRRLVERNDDEPLEWGTTERGESRIPSVSLKEQLPIVALLVAAGGFAATNAGVDPGTVVSIVLLAVFALLMYVLMWPAYVHVLWRLPIAALLIRGEIAVVEEVGLSTVELGGIMELVEGKPSHLDDAALDRIADAIRSLEERSEAEE